MEERGGWLPGVDTVGGGVTDGGAVLRDGDEEGAGTDDRVVAGGAVEGTEGAVEIEEAEESGAVVTGGVVDGELWGTCEACT